MKQFSHYLQVKKQQNFAIKLSPIQDFPKHEHSCKCQMCTQYEHHRLQEILNKKSTELSRKVSQIQHKKRITSQYFEYVLKRLLIPHHKIINKGINVHIPEICFYKDGQAESLFMNIEQQQKDKVVDEGFQRSNTSNSRGSISKDFRRQTIVVRIKKEKLNNTQIQKILSQKRRKYREKIKNLSQRKKILKKQSIYGKQEVIPETKDAVVVHYLDGYEQLMTENQFINLMLRRKQDPVFKGIDFIKNFIGVSHEDKSMKYVKYSETDIQYDALFQRSKLLMKIYGRNIISGEPAFITQEQQTTFCNSLKTQDLDAYASYELYKIVHFIEYFYDQKIQEISVKFLYNQCQELYLLHVYKLTKIDLVKYKWTNDIYMKKVQEEQLKIFEKSQKMNIQNEEEMDPLMKNNCNKIEQQMRSYYESMKNMYGLSEIHEDDREEIANNKFFQILHPEIKMPISEILKNNSMTVDVFQRKYLGYKKHKKSVAHQFNSNMIKTLHKLIPKLKVSQAHEIEDVNFPKTPRTRFSHQKRSFSQGNTLSTFNKTLTLQG